MTYPTAKSYSAWRARRLKKNPGPQRAMAELARVLCPPIGSQFEDCWRRAVMVDEVDPRLQHLLFDFDDVRSSTSRKERMRDIVLGYDRGGGVV